MKVASRVAFCLLLAVMGVACGGGAESRSGGAVAVRVNASALGTRADIAGVWVRLTPTSGAAAVQGWATGAPSIWSIVFGQIPAGDYDVYAKAVDAAQTTLYETPAPYPGGPITVTAGGQAQVALILQELHPPAPPIDSAPYLTSLFVSQSRIDESTVVRLDATAVDPDAGDALTFAWTGTGGGAFGPVTSDATTTHSTWTPPGDGSFTVTVAVTDSHGSSAQLSIAIEVSNAAGEGTVVVIAGLNSPPEIVNLSSSNAEGVAGLPIPLSAVVRDLDGDALVFTWSSGCAGSFGPVDETTDSSGTRSATTFTAAAAPLSGQCRFRLSATDGRGGSTTGMLDVSFPSASVGEGPAFYIVASGLDLSANGSLDIAAVASDGASHPTWSYAWSDGRAGSASGAFDAAVAADSSHQRYAPADCVLVGSGDQALDVSVVVTDTATSATAEKAVAVVVHCPLATYYTTKTPYRPHQEASTYEPAPAGFAPAFTEIVARHGSRGLSSLKYDAAAYNMWQKALADGALTALGANLGPDIQRFMRANALLGAGVPGISNPGYGNLTQTGIAEQRQLAVRLLARLPAYFADVAASAGSPAPRSIVVVSSGVDRAVDSSSFFSSEIAAESAALGSLLVKPAAPAGYPAGAPVTQPAGTNRFLLYFHKLAAKTDLVTDVADPYYATYQNSLAFQAYATDADMNAKVRAILADPSAKAAARAALQTIFTDDFIGKIDDGTYTFANTGTYSFTSDDGTYTTTLTGDGKTTVASITDAASMLYNLYVVGPAMTHEVNVDFTPYIPAEPAKVLAYLQDAQDFYQMGPGIQEANPVTYKMAQVLEDDFFSEIDAIAAGDLSHAAKLRFTHAEIIVPFASILGLKNVFVPVPNAATYAYATNPWRGEIVSPFAANVQWDVYGDAAGALLVKMLYNEKETDFKADCDGARHAPRSHYYDYGKLKTCYGRP